ncbi:hypothetical protein E3N88_34341 [Mikania micrantha]|uniref:Uncharacterized protein n=1 Tax=Mikania micrantha TaxID=192012 RepID=A0A5N6LY44_9ASTR|nr:hypothetical protein E3N88_34341 [Mikania micrantha]
MVSCSTMISLFMSSGIVISIDSSLYQFQAYSPQFKVQKLYLSVYFSTYFDTSSTPDNESVTKVRLDVSKLSIRSAYHDEISETVGNDNRFKRLSQQEKKLELKSGDSNRETLENERRFERVSQEEKDDGLPPIDLRYGRLTGNILRERHRTQGMSGLEKMADEAWSLGGHGMRFMNTMKKIPSCLLYSKGNMNSVHHGYQSVVKN